MDFAFWLKMQGFSEKCRFRAQGLASYVQNDGEYIAMEHCEDGTWFVVYHNRPRLVGRKGK